MLGDDFDAALAGARAGEEWGFAALYREFAPAVLGFLRGRIPSDAEDVASTVWLDVARSLCRFEGDEPGFRAWLFTIVRRRLLNEFRRQRRVRAELHDPATMPAAFASGDPETIVLAEIGAADAIALIGQVLPDLQANVVLLRVVAELPVPDIAELLGLTPGHVRVLSHRGLRTLAEHFSRPAVTRAAGSEISELP